MADVTQAEAARLAGEAAAQAVAAERARSAAIRTAPEAEGRTALADHLVSSTDMTVEAARAVLAAAPKQEAAPAPGNALNAAMAASPGPSVGADNADNVGAGRTPDRILANYGQVTGHKFRPAVGVQ